jgi:hypothetical protein
MEDPGAELVAHPQVAVLAPLQRLGIEVGPRQQSIGRPLDGEADDAVRVPELDEVVESDCDRSCAALCQLEIGTDEIRSKQEIERVRLVPEAVVGHRQVLARSAPGDDRREALHGLGRRRERDPVDRLTGEEGAGRWPGSVRVDR